jgi:hypothetical protein
MEDETAGDLYGLRDLLEFDISVAHDLTTTEFHELCQQEIDFLHYIGHVDEGGVVCADGSLDLRTIEDTGVRAFLLNACHSYKQGEALVDAGADGGLVTLSRVFNDQATKMGRLAARLLNHGFPLDATMNVLSHGPLSSHRYASVGDYRANVCQSPEITPALVKFYDVGSDTIEFSVREYTMDRHCLGQTRQPMLSEQAGWHLAGGMTRDWTLPNSEAVSYAKDASYPVLYDGDIKWDLDHFNTG